MSFLKKLSPKYHTRMLSMIALAAIAALTGGCVMMKNKGEYSMSPAQGDLPKVLFELNFKNKYEASVAGGYPNPTNQNLPELVKGMDGGYAARFNTSAALRYQTKGNLSASRGAYAIWFRMPSDGTDVNGQVYTLFQAAEAQSSNSLCLTLKGGNALQFIPGDEKGVFSFMPQVYQWKKDEWHHIAVSWDAGGEGYTVYLDGQQSSIGGNALNLGPKTFIVPKWDVVVNEGFIIGANTVSGNRSWQADVAEVRIFEEPLSSEQVQLEYSRRGELGIRVKALDSYLFAGSTQNCRVILNNLSDTDLQVSPRHEIRNEKGERLLSGSLDKLTIAAKGQYRTIIPVLLPQPGKYTLNIRIGKKEQVLPLMALVDTFNATGLEQKSTLIGQVDAVQTKDIVESSVAKTKVINSPIGQYREAASKKDSRFALKFDIQDVGAPHMAVIRYPDDKARTMEIVLQDLLTAGYRQGDCGVFTGNEYLLSGKMIEQRIYFWPTSARMAFIFMTVVENQPAAVADIKLYKLEGKLPTLTVNPFQGSVAARSFGMYYEDPQITQSFGTKPFFPDFEMALDRLLDYMQWFGQDILSYPIAWYTGTLYDSDVEPLGYNLYSRPHPYNFPQYIMKKMQVRGMRFIGNLHLHDLPSLVPYAITDEKRILAGEETVINIRNDNKPYLSSRHGQDTSYNPIDPKVQQAVKNVIGEILDRFGDEPAFSGIRFVLNRQKLMSFGSLESGYNDTNLQRFQKDSGTTIPVYSLSDPQRFKKSYDWLMANAKEKWIDWRCMMIHEYYKEISNMLTAKRADLTLDVVWTPDRPLDPILSRYLTEPDVLRRICREWGIDPALFEKDKNISISYTFRPADYRQAIAKQEKKGQLGFEDFRTRSYAPEIVELLRHLPNTTAVIHDSYFENDIGAKAPLPGLGEGIGVKEITGRVSTLNPNTFNALEPYVAALNNLDALSITRGGLVIGTQGIEYYLGKFAKAYRTLPAVKFDDVETLSDPVRVRQCRLDGRNYFYILNRLPVAVKLSISLSGTDDVRDLITGDTLKTGGKMKITLEPYDLRTFSAAENQLVIDGNTEVENAFILDLKDKVAKAEQRYEQMKAEGKNLTDVTPYIELARNYLDKGSYARLHFLLQETWNR